MITISPANQGAAFKQFVRLPRELYAGMPGYQPPLDFERAEMLDHSKAHFFENGEACYFLASRDGRPVGRISAQIDHLHKARPGNEEIGFFGCLDAIDDIDVTKTLVEAAFAWLEARGVKRAQGPHLLSMNGEPGLMIEGQEQPPLILAPWHPAYLADHLQSLGLVAVKNLYFYALDLASSDFLAQSKISRLLDRQTGLSVRGLRMDQLDDEAEIVVRLYNDAWSNNWGFIPLEVGEIQQMLKTLKPLMHPDAGLIVERNGEPVACTVIIPNVSEMFSDLGGKPSLFGWLKLMKRFVTKDFTTGRIILMGITQKYRHSSMAATLLLTMMAELTNRKKRHDLKYLEAGWVLEDNKALIKLLAEFDLPVSRRYQIFEMPVSEGSS